MNFNKFKEDILPTLFIIVFVPLTIYFLITKKILFIILSLLSTLLIINIVKTSKSSINNKKKIRKLNYNIKEALIKLELIKIQNNSYLDLENDIFKKNEIIKLQEWLNENKNLFSEINSINIKIISANNLDLNNFIMKYNEIANSFAVHEESTI